MTRWMFLGDDSRQIFLSQLLHVDRKRINTDESFTLRRGRTKFSRAVTKSGKIIISSVYLPPGTEIFVPAYSDDFSFDFYSLDKCAIFEMFPFRKESVAEIAQILELNSEGPDLLFVLMDFYGEKNPAFSSESVESYFRKKNRDVVVVKKEPDIFKVLRWDKPLLTGVIRELHGELMDVYTRSENILAKYQNFLIEQTNFGCLSNAAKKRIVSFENIRGKSHIWMTYQEIALQFLLPPSNVGGLSALIKFYRDALYGTDNPFASLIWNEERDCKRFTRNLREKFLQFTRTPRKFQYFLSDDENKSEHIYLSLIKPGSKFGGIAEEFLAAYEGFVYGEVPEILIAELEAHVQKMEQAIS